MNADFAELRDFIGDLCRLDQASPGLSDRCIEDFAHQWQEAEDIDHCTLGAKISVELVARRIAGLFKLPEKLCEQAAAEAMLNTRWQIARHVLDWYLTEYGIRPAAERQPPSEPASVPRRQVNIRMEATR